MWSTIREGFRVARQAIGLRHLILLAVLFLVSLPFILAVFVLCVPVWFVAVVGLWISNKVRGVGKRLDDPVFGPIVYEGSSSWSAVCELKSLGGSFGIQVIAPRATGPGPSQHELLRKLIQHQGEIRPQVEASLFRQYQTVQPLLCEEAMQSRHMTPDLSDHYLESIPALEKPAQIWSLLSDGSISLKDQPGCFTMYWECTWDPEHAVSATFVNWMLREDADE